MAERRRATARPQLLSYKQATRYMAKVARREARFLAAGVGYDRATGLTHDGFNIDFDTGKLRGGPRNWSAASKESLHLILAQKALTGDAMAKRLLSPKNPAQGPQVALEILTKKIHSYQRFNADYPGYGGFLPWFKVEGGKVSPTSNWQDRVPGLDNGQLVWSLYVVAKSLKQLGHAKLAKQYEAHVKLMADNVVNVFYDAKEKKFRAEAKLVRGNGVAPQRNRYEANIGPDTENSFLHDAYEGLMLCHFADLFGNWAKHPAGKEAIWAKARRKPVTYTTKAGERITLSIGHWHSSHETWSNLVLPINDLPLANQLFTNEQKARTAHAADTKTWMRASTHRPGKDSTVPGYVSDLGIRAPGITKRKVFKDPIYAPYATFPLAMVDANKPGINKNARRVFASWLKTMNEAPRMWGPFGMGESFTGDGKQMAPVLTWDGKVLPLISWMGGISGDVRKNLKSDGLYDAFMKRVKTDYRLFENHPIEGKKLHLRAPTARVPQGLPAFMK